jgi:hypothetical protein
MPDDSRAALILFSSLLIHMWRVRNLTFPYTLHLYRVGTPFIRRIFMPTTENDRRNLQQPVLEHPSMPDHDRTKDPGMHAAVPDESAELDVMGPGALDESEIAAPDQAFEQILKSGIESNKGRIPEDPNNWLTSDDDKSLEHDPEDRGDSAPDILEGNEP